MPSLALGTALPRRRRRRLLTALQRIFAPADLGALIDPSVQGSAYQESTGATPVTLDGQPMGLILDSRYGLVRGADVYRPFSSGTGWTMGAGTARDATGVQFTAVANSGFADSTVVVPTVVGESYEVRFTVTNYVGGAVRLLVYTSNAAGVTPSVSANGTYRFIVHTTGAGSQSQVVKIQATGASSINTFRIEGVSVKRVQGRHAIQATAGLRAFRQAGNLIDYDGVDDAHSIALPGAAGSNWTVARAIPGVGAQILTGQTVVDPFVSNVDTHLLFLINRALTVGETTTLTQVLIDRADVEQPFGLLLDEAGDQMTDELGNFLLG